MKRTVWIVVLLLIVIAFGLLIFGREQAEAPEEELEANINNMQTIRITSSSFENRGDIPEKFTCEGDNMSPELEISGLPDGTQSLALIVDDPDIPQEVKSKIGKDEFVHWVMFNIPPETEAIGENTSLGTEGVNGSGELGYTGPCPPTEFEPTEHRYFFRVYALDQVLNLEEGATKEELLGAMEGHVLGQGELMGKFDRAN